MAQMHNPPHPGEVLREYLGEMRVAEAADRLMVSRSLISRVLNAKARISADLSLRLADALSTDPGLWGRLQHNYDLWYATRKGASDQNHVAQSPSDVLKNERPR